MVNEQLKQLGHGEQERLPHLILYHLRPQDLTGNVLLPFSQLPTDLQKNSKGKYFNRPHTQQIDIPRLNCKWQDVLFLTAVSPEKIAQTLKENGLKVPSSLSSYYAIPLQILDLDKTLVYWYNKPFPQQGGLPEDELIELSKGGLTEKQILDLQIIPRATIDYYRECQRKGEKPLLWCHIPHVLYKGRIDTTNTSISCIS